MEKVKTVYSERYEGDVVGYFNYNVFTQARDDMIRYSDLEAKVIGDKGKITIKRGDGDIIIYSYVKRGENWYVDDIRFINYNKNYDKSERQLMNDFINEEP